MNIIKKLILTDVVHPSIIALNNTQLLNELVLRNLSNFVIE